MAPPRVSHINVGTGEDVSIREILDVSRLAALGWRARIGLEEGLRSAYGWYRENVGVVRG